MTYRNEREAHLYFDSDEYVGKIVSPAPRIPRREHYKPEPDRDGWLIAGMLGVVFAASWALVAYWSVIITVLRGVAR